MELAIGASPADNTSIDRNPAGHGVCWQPIRG